MVRRHHEEIAAVPMLLTTISLIWLKWKASREK